MKTFIAILLLCSACEGSTFRGHTPREATPAAASKENIDPDGDAAPRPADTTKEANVDEDKVESPKKITGGFLHCAHLVPPTATSASLGCEFKSSEGSPIVIEPSKIDISITTESLSGVEVSIKKADTPTSGTVAWIEAHSTQVNVEESIKKLQVKVQATPGYRDVESSTYTLGAITEPPTPVAPTAVWGLAAIGQSCQAYCSSQSKKFDPETMNTKILKAENPNTACHALIRELGIPAINTGTYPSETSAGCVYSSTDEATAVANASAPNDGKLVVAGSIQACPCK